MKRIEYKTWLTYNSKLSTLATSVQTSDWCLIAREFGEPLKIGKQMTVFSETKTGESVDSAEKWASIDWDEVRRLQMRIAEAVKEERWGKVKALQYLLTHPFYAKALAVKRVTSTKQVQIHMILNTELISGADGIKRTHGYSRRYRPGSTAKSNLHEVNSRGFPQGRPYKCLSRITGNCHVRFLGGKGGGMPLTYPISKNMDIK